jgi:predicted O-linked N-acetylglucosamine transferase (SPINDLY family)/molybdenum cofactor biosynthesis enzyme MoaA
MTQPLLFAAPERLRRLQIEVTTGCNLRCAGCQRTLGMADGTWRNAHMPVGRFAALLRNAPPADAIILQGIGEPTLHPHLREMVAQARAAGKFGLVSFNTNALLRDTAYYAALRDVGLGHVSVSVDSLQPDTAEALRAGTDTHALKAAIQALIGLFQGAVTLSVVLSRRNLSELADLLTELHGLGGRVIEVQPLVSYAAAIDPLALDGAELRAAHAIIRSANQRLPGLSALPAAAMTPNGSRCRRPFHAAYVTVEGFLTPCCLTNDSALFGQTSLEALPWAEAWASPGVRQFLSDYFDREPAICHGCAFNPSGATASPHVDIATARRLQQAGDLRGAEAAFQALIGGPDAAEALQGLGLLRFQAGETATALPLLLAAEAMAPDARSRHNAATVLAMAGRRDEAIARQRQNLAEFPEYVPSYNALVGLLEQEGDRAGAGSALVALIERAIGAGHGALIEQAVARLAALAPDHPVLLRVANRLRIAGRQDQALVLLDARLGHAPGDLGAALTLAMTRLAVVHGSVGEMAERRAAYRQDLATVADLVAEADRTALVAGAAAVGSAKPFYLSYQGEDDRDLQRQYGQAVTRMMAAAYPARLPSPVPAARIRVGFATGYFHLHSISKLFGGWITGLDRTKFDVFGYHLGEGEDATSAALGATCTSFHRGTRDDEAWVRAMQNDALDVLIYPEIGMYPTAVRLGCRRIAPLQCVAWGHPVTSGLPEIDVFLSSALMEPPDGAAHYTERLVRLPNLSICYEALPAPVGRLTRAGMGFGANEIVYVCCQSLFKYHPRDDAVLVAIAAAVPAARFLFIGDPAHDPNARRLKSRLLSAGLDERRLRFVPPVPAEDFPSLLRAGDVYLDSLGWSGGNTTLEALTCDLPVVTLPGPLMRGRHSAAILTMMGLEDAIAVSSEDYVARAVVLADPAARTAMRVEVQARKHRLLGDKTPIRALEAFLEAEVAARARVLEDA